MEKGNRIWIREKERNGGDGLEGKGEGDEGVKGEDGVERAGEREEK